MNSTGKIAWITGASSGIGYALALRLSRRGWMVAASARGRAGLDRLVAEMPNRIRAFELDVTDASAAAETVRQIEADMGPIDLAVLNAGSYFPTTAEDFSIANFRRTVEVNLMGEVNCMGGVVPSMLSRRSGHIVLMGSLTAFVGLPTAASYGATKAALNSVAQAFKPDFERFGITISVINPGFVKTPLTDKNRFPMPFLIGVDAAVDHIMRGIERQRFDISFPWQMSFLVRLLAALPDWAKFAITRRMLPR